MPADHELDPLDRWLNQQVRPLPPPDGTFELITRRARRRRIRKAVVSVASAAAVAAVIGVAVPVGMSLHLTPPPQNASLAGGQVAPTSTGTQSPLSAANKVTPASVPSSAASPVPSVAGPKGGYLPPNFQPYSVTWDSLNTGWVIGPAGTPGQCDNANPDICTSVARTDDGGRTWHGLPAPNTGTSDGGSDGVSGIRFLDGKNGWAFGPELWATHDGGESWTQIPAGGQRVTDLETAGNRAYALFAQCAGTHPFSFAADCTSYTLMTTVADSDQWTPVGGPTTGLANRGVAAAAAIALLDGKGYLSAPDGTLYSGPIGGAWQRAGALPCQPGNPQPSGVPARGSVAPMTATALATVCADSPTSPPKVYTSSDAGATWSLVTASWAGIAGPGVAFSFTATASGTLLLASSQGIFLLPKGAAHWQVPVTSGSAAPQGGFAYIGMTSSQQGVALPANTALHEIYMTTDGGQTWQARPIKS